MVRTRTSRSWSRLQRIHTCSRLRSIGINDGTAQLSINRGQWASVRREPPVVRIARGDGRVSQLVGKVLSTGRPGLQIQLVDAPNVPFIIHTRAQGSFQL